MEHLLRGLGLSSQSDLFRECERKTGTTAEACSLFWLVGPKQVGKQSMTLWEEVLSPEVNQVEKFVSLWPFDGSLIDLLDQSPCVIAEGYPAQYLARIGIQKNFGKKSESKRSQVSVPILAWFEGNGVNVDEGIAGKIRRGFSGNDGEDDALDAVIGLIGFLESILNPKSSLEPSSDSARTVEGWILGKEVNHQRKQVEQKRSTSRMDFPNAKSN